VKTAFDISKKHIEDFRKGTFIRHRVEGKPMITLEHDYFMKILEEKERFRLQAMRKKK
jgi:hypothetical protein